MNNKHYNIKSELEEATESLLEMLNECLDEDCPIKRVEGEVLRMVASHRSKLYNA